MTTSGEGPPSCILSRELTSQPRIHQMNLMVMTNWLEECPLLAKLQCPAHNLQNSANRLWRTSAESKKIGLRLLRIENMSKMLGRNQKAAMARMSAMSIFTVSCYKVSHLQDLIWKLWVLMQWGLARDLRINTSSFLEESAARLGTKLSETKFYRKKKEILCKQRRDWQGECDL